HCMPVIEIDDLGVWECLDGFLDFMNERKIASRRGSRKHLRQRHNRDNQAVPSRFEKSREDGRIRLTACQILDDPDGINTDGLIASLGFPYEGVDERSIDGFWRACRPSWRSGSSHPSRSSRTN